MKIDDRYRRASKATLFQGDCRDLLAQIPAQSAQLIVTSPPYNIGKGYERKRRVLEDYLEEQASVIAECVRILKDGGSICWEVGNHIAGPQEILPLDIALYPLFASHGLRLRNRIVWHFEHGLHCSKRLSGRYETILWFTKGDDYTFHLDAIRVPQKYPGKKAFKGPRIGQLTSNPLGKNPGDVWIIPNVKHNNVEKTDHPCQFPVELVERLVLALTKERDLVIDPYIGVGSTAVAAVKHGRRAAGADIVLANCYYQRMATIAIAIGYSHLFGEEIIRFRYPEIAADIDDICKLRVTSPTASREKTKVGKLVYRGENFNPVIADHFRKRGWEPRRLPYGGEVDFVKERVAMEVQFGKYSFVAYDLTKLQDPFTLDIIDVGIEIMPAASLTARMYTGVPNFNSEMSRLQARGRNQPPCRSGSSAWTLPNRHCPQFAPTSRSQI